MSANPMSKHTPTPWRYDYGNWEIESENNKAYRHGVAWFNDRDEKNPIDPVEDALHIVHCVNLHYELVRALQDYIILQKSEGIEPRYTTELLNRAIGKP